MLMWTGQKGGLTPNSLECAVLLPLLEEPEASDRNPCLAPHVLAAGIGSFFCLALLVFSCSIFTYCTKTRVQGPFKQSKETSEEFKHLLDSSSRKQMRFITDFSASF